ncbi:hypothetical protein GCM10023178_06720 [Actinomadura luteofluorescens]
MVPPLAPHRRASYLTHIHLIYDSYFGMPLLLPRCSPLPPWGVSLKSLIYRSREVGLMSEATARCGYQRIKQMRKLGLIVAEPVTHYGVEEPADSRSR